MNDFDKDKPNLSAEDQETWNEFVREFDDAQSEEENFEELLNQSEELIEESEEQETLDSVVQKKVKAQALRGENPPSHPAQLDKRTLEKLRKGKMKIEARLDLHGMTREIAHDALEKFIIQCAQNNLRHVLIITGKGKSKSFSEDWLTPGQGVLKNNVPYWLEGSVLRPYILKYCLAQPKDGGSGALYVYLKRNR